MQPGAPLSSLCAHAPCRTDYCVEEWPKRWSSKAKTEKKKKLTINVAKCFKLMTLVFGDVALSTVVPTTTSNQPHGHRRLLFLAPDVEKCRRSEAVWFFCVCDLIS